MPRSLTVASEVGFRPYTLVDFKLSHISERTSFIWLAAYIPAFLVHGPGVVVPPLNEVYSKEMPGQTTGTLWHTSFSLFESGFGPCITVVRTVVDCCDGPARSRGITARSSIPARSNHRQRKS